MGIIEISLGRVGSSSKIKDRPENPTIPMRDQYGETIPETHR